MDHFEFVGEIIKRSLIIPAVEFCYTRERDDFPVDARGFYRPFERNDSLINYNFMSIYQN